MDAAHGVDPLHRGHARQRAAPALRGDFELEPRDVACALARRIGGGLGDHGAAVRVLPVRPGIVAPDGLAVEHEGGDRLAQRPCELAVGAGLALVDLAPSACIVATTLSPGAAIAAGTCADAAPANASTAGTDSSRLRRTMRMGPSSSNSRRSRPDAENRA